MRFIMRDTEEGVCAEEGVERWVFVEAGVGRVDCVVVGGVGEEKFVGGDAN